MTTSMIELLVLATSSCALAAALWVAIGSLRFFITTQRHGRKAQKRIAP